MFKTWPQLSQVNYARKCPVSKETPPQWGYEAETSGRRSLMGPTTTLHYSPQCSLHTHRVVSAPAEAPQMLCGHTYGWRLDANAIAVRWIS